MLNSSQSSLENLAKAHKFYEENLFVEEAYTNKIFSLNTVYVVYFVVILIWQFGNFSSVHQI